MTVENSLDQKSCFIESFDSVRYTQLSGDQTHTEVSTSDKEEREAQSEIELMYSLMLGQKIVIPEAHSFDSAGFLSIVSVALKARDEILKFIPYGLEKAWIQEPFVLVKRAMFQSYLDLVSQRIKQPTFILSAMPDLNNKVSLREEVSNLMREKNFDKISNLLSQELTHDSHQHCAKKMDQIRQINDYFSSRYVSSQEAMNLPEELERYVYNLIDVKHIPESLQQKEGFNRIRNGLFTLKEKKINFLNRSEVRNRGRDHLNIDDYLGVLEYVDSCYNAVLYKAIGADTGIMTTAATTKGRYVLLAQRLSEESASLGSRDRVTIKYNNQREEVFKKKLRDWCQSRQERWQGLWKILLDPNWLNSVRNLIYAPDETVRDAHRSHIKELNNLVLRHSSVNLSVDEPKALTPSVEVVVNNDTIMSFEHHLEQERKNLEQGRGEVENSGKSVDGSTPGMDR